MEFKGTKGKWFVIDGWDENGKGSFPSIVMHGTEEHYRKSYGRNGITINCSHDQKVESLMANAQLISCAPEMLDMLNKLRKEVDFGYSAWGNDKGYIISEELEELIKKATTI